jgi:hypothetical protein
MEPVQPQPKSLGKKDQGPCYCEYYKVDGTGPWLCRYANPPSGYYCRSTVDDRKRHSSYTCISPTLIPPGGKRGKSHNSPRTRTEYCRYICHDGKFYLVEGRCGAGTYCPTNLLGYLDAHNFSSLHAALEQIQLNAGLPVAQQQKEVVINITIHPACAKECVNCEHEKGKAAKTQSAP